VYGVDGRRRRKLLSVRLSDEGAPSETGILGTWPMEEGRVVSIYDDCLSVW